MADAQAPIKRPLSPHLQIYRLTLSMIMSGVHRITGLALCAGMIMLTLWLLATAAGRNAHDTFTAFASSVLYSHARTRRSSCSLADRRR